MTLINSKIFVIWVLILFGQQTTLAKSEAEYLTIQIYDTADPQKFFLNVFYSINDAELDFKNNDILGISENGMYEIKVFLDKSTEPKSYKFNLEPYKPLLFVKTDKKYNNKGIKRKYATKNIKFNPKFRPEKIQLIKDGILLNEINQNDFK